MSNEERPEIRLKRHLEAVDWFFRLHGEGFSTEQTEQWIEWCNADPANQRTFERLMPLWQARSAAARVPAAGPPVTLPSSVEGAARRRAVPRRRWLLAASVAACLSASLWMLAHLQSGDMERLGPEAHMSSDVGQIRSALLADGSHMSLGAQSRITVRFARNHREIDLERGEALFRVQHDRTRPFVVSAGDVQVVAVGTVFDVDRRGSRVSVTVQEGIVEVLDRRPGAPGSAAPRRVARGGQLIIDQSGAEPADFRQVNPGSADAWRRGHLEYVGEPLSAIIDDLNRYSSRQIVLQDAGLGDLRYSGTIEVNVIDEWLRALPDIFSVQVELGHDHRVVITLPQAQKD